MTRPREGHATSIRSSKGKEVVLLTKGFVTTRSSMNDVLRRGISAIVVAVVMVSTRSLRATSVEEVDEGVEDEFFLKSAMGGPGKMLPLFSLLMMIHDLICAIASTSSLCWKHFQSYLVFILFILYPQVVRP